MPIARALRLWSLSLGCCFSFLLSGCAGNGSSSQPVENPVPVIQSVSPTAVAAGSAGFTLTITGSNFLVSSTLTWNGTPQKATFVNSSQLTTTIAATQLAATGTIQLVVLNPQPGGGQASITFSVSAPAAPAVATVSPNTLTVGGSAFTLTVTGSNFVSASLVQWNGVSQPTTYIDNANLTAAIPASSLTASNAGNLPITVATPAPGGGSSNSISVLVEYPLPSILSLNPSGVLIGSAAFTMTVNGTNFANGATVFVNNLSRVTQFVNSTQLSASILASDLSGSAANLAVTVQNPSPSAGISNVFPFAVQNPAPVLSLVTPSSMLAGNSTSVAITGSGFLVGATVQIGNRSFSASGSSTSLTALIDVPVGTNTLTVMNPAPTVGSSNGVPITGDAAGPGLSLTVASVDPDGNVGLTDNSGLGGALSSTGRYYIFMTAGSREGLLFTDFDLRDTCLGAPPNCIASSTRVGEMGYCYKCNVIGVSTDGRYVALGDGTGTAYLEDLCTGAPSGCVPTTTDIPVWTPGLHYAPQRDYMTPNARYLSDHGFSPPSLPAYINDTCAGAAPGCALAQLLVATQDQDAYAPMLTDDGRYFAYSDPNTSQVLLHDCCLGASPGCSPSDSAISTANCGTPSISGDAQYVVYSCSDGFKLQATCLNAPLACDSAPMQVDASSPSPIPRVSAGGRYVAYAPSTATISGQALANAMVFVFDSCLGAGSGCVQRSAPLCLNSSGAVANADCGLTGMTTDGQYVAFSSASTNLGQTVRQGYSVSYIVKNPLF